MDQDSTIAPAAERPAPPRRASALRRVPAGLAGLALLACAALLLRGLPLAAALLGMAAAAGIVRWRRRPYTGLTGWLGATLGVAIAFATFVGIALARTPSGSFEKARQDAIARQAQHPQQLPEWIRRYVPQPQPPRAVTAATTRVTFSRPFFWWILLMTVAFGGLMFGAFVGTLAWGGMSLLLYGARGRWPAAPREPHAAGTA